MRTEQNKFQFVLPEMLKLQTEYREKVRDLHPLQETYFIQRRNVRLSAGLMKKDNAAIYYSSVGVFGSRTK